MKSIEQMSEEIRSLGPWHHDIPLTEQFSTGKAFAASGTLERDANHNVSLLALADSFRSIVDTIYDDGLKGKRFLDCACNAGVYCFTAREMEADFSFGFDARDHWINQANWVKSHRTVSPTDRIQFSVCDLYDLDKRNLPLFDVTMFKGIFYHLPDPVAGLKKAADLTREVLIFNSQTSWGDPDGYLLPGLENVTSRMSGVYGLNWRPTGPKVMTPILKYLGFCEAKLQTFRQNPRNPELGRMELYATKVPGLLDKFSVPKLF